MKKHRTDSERVLASCQGLVHESIQRAQAYRRNLRVAVLQLREKSAERARGLGGDAHAGEADLLSGHRRAAALAEHGVEVDGRGDEVDVRRDVFGEVIFVTACKCIATKSASAPPDYQPDA